MKQLLLLSTILLIAATSFAQSDKFQKSMQANIAMLDSAKNSEDYTSVAATFERIGDAEKTQWLPYYYAALANIWKSFVDTKANHDALADKADALIAKAEAIEPKNSELFLLKSMSATVHMIVDPMNRWQKYGAISREALTTAKQLDPTNPRPYLWEGQSLLQTPASFGGGSDKAKPVFEKSLALYKTFKPVNNLYPNWGKENSEKMLSSIK
jgi:hypothetical protein